MNDPKNQPADGAWGDEVDPNQPRSAIDKLAQDARVTKEARMPAPGEKLSDVQLDELRERLAARVGRYNISNREIGKQIGLGQSTINQWRNGTYQGDVQHVARKLIAWLEQHERGERPGMPEGFVTTRVAERILAVLKSTQARRWMSVIYGPAGVSKSLCCQAALDLIAGSVHIEVVKGESRAPQFAREWAARLGLRTTGSLGQLERRIIDALRGTNRLHMIDEAHYLSKDALHVVRDIHKQAKVGIVLLGTIDVEQNVDDSSEFYGQISRLMLHRYDIVEEAAQDGEPLFTVDDVVKLASSMRLRLTGDGAEYLSERASIPGSGCLGAAVGLLYNAAILADGKAITARLLRSAELSNQGRRNYERVQLRREQRRKVAVA